MSTQLTGLPYNIPGVLYARVTPNNTTIATSFTGGTDTDVIEEVIAAPFLATGKISTYLNDTIVTGVATDFINQFAANQYLYYFDGLGNPVLLGEIDTVVDQVTMVLKQDAIEVITDKNAGASRSRLSGFEDIYIRVPTVVRNFTQGQQTPGGPTVTTVTEVYIPNLGEWRINNFLSPFSLNNPSVSSLSRYSYPGNVVSVDTTSTTQQKNIPFTVECVTAFKAVGASQIMPTGSSLPAYIWLKINPYGNNGTDLGAKTMYTMVTASSFQFGGVLKYNMSQADLLSLGYSQSNIQN